MPISHVILDKCVEITLCQLSFTNIQFYKEASYDIQYQVNAPTGKDFLLHVYFNGQNKITKINFTPRTITELDFMQQAQSELAQLKGQPISDSDYA